MSTGTRPSRAGGVDQPSRRSVTKGLAWSVPAVTVASAAPAFAASCIKVPPFAEANGWSITTTGTAADGWARFVGNIFITNADPARGNTYTSTASLSLQLVAGVTYTFRAPWTAHVTNTLPMQGNLRINGVNIGATVDTASNVASGTVVGSFTPTTSGTYTLQWFNTITQSGNTVVGDDIRVSPITVGCS